MQKMQYWGRQKIQRQSCRKYSKWQAVHTEVIIWEIEYREVGKYRGNRAGNTVQRKVANTEVIKQYCSAG